MSKVGMTGWFGVGISVGSFFLISWTGFSQQGGPPAGPAQKVDWTAFLPAGEGKFQVAAYCPLCHSIQPIVSDRREDEDGWMQTVERMVEDNHAPIQDDDIPVIGKYLAHHFSRSTPILELPIHINTAPKEILVMLGSLSGAEVQKILDARAKEKVKDFKALEAIVGSGKLSKYESVISFGDGSDKPK